MGINYSGLDLRGGRGPGPRPPTNRGPRTKAPQNKKKHLKRKKTKHYLTDRSDVIFKAPNAQKSNFPPRGPYIAPTDLVAGGEGTRGPLHNNPTPVLGPVIRPRFYGSQGLIHYRILLLSTVNMIIIAYY